MKTKILSVVVCFVLIMTMFAGCSNFTPLVGGPEVNAMVTSNGGTAVRKGDYLYFVNGYLDSTVLAEGDNEYGDEENAAIYRAQLDTSGNLMTDEEGALINIQIVVPKIVGFNNGGFYIFDNYIYYATPTILKDKTGKVRFDLVDFYRAKLDGTQITKIYATQDYSDSAKFAFYKIDEAVYLVIYNGTSVISLAITNVISAPVTMIASATSVALPKVSEYNADNNVVADINKYVYYSRALDSEIDGTILEFGNTLAKVQIGTTTEQILIQDNVWSYTAGSIKNDALYYTKTSTNSLNSKNYFRDLAQGVFVNNIETQITGTYYSSITVLDFENGNNRGVVVNDDSKLLLITDVFSSTGIEVLVNEKATLLFGRGDYVYYSHGDNNRVARINVKTKSIDELSSEDAKINVGNNLKIDYDNDYIYFLQTHTNDLLTSIYLERVKITTTTFESEFIGVLETQDLPDETEE